MAYFNTAATGLASARLAARYHQVIDEWAAGGFDFGRGELAAENAQPAVARLIGADAADIALIPSVFRCRGTGRRPVRPSEAGRQRRDRTARVQLEPLPVAATAQPGLRRPAGPFRHGGIEPDDVRTEVDAGTLLVAFSGVQAATGHRSDIAAISNVARNVGAVVFVDGSQMLGALPAPDDVHHVDVLVASDHKFLLNAGRGMGYCYLSPAMQQRLIRPTPAGGPARSRSKASSDPR